MLDIKKVLADAERELSEEKAKAATLKIKAQLKRIADAEKIVANEKLILETICKDITVA